MKSLAEIKEAIGAKLRIRNHSAEISKSRQILAGFENRSGKISLSELVTQKSTTRLIEEIKTLESPSEPKASMSTPNATAAQQYWADAKSGKPLGFLASNLAKEVITIALAENSALSKAPTPAASLQAPAPVAAARPAALPAKSVPTAAEIAAEMLEQQRSESSGEGLLAKFESLPAAERHSFYNAHKGALKQAEAARAAKQAAEARDASVAALRANKPKSNN